MPTSRMLEAYFDESGTHQGSRLMCVAGYVFTPTQRACFERECEEILAPFGLAFFHMSDCANGAGVYKTMSLPDRCAIETRLIGAIKRRARFGVAVSLRPDEFARVYAFDGLEREFSPYTLCIFGCLSLLNCKLDDSGERDHIAYRFESGHAREREAKKYLGELANRVERLLETEFRYGSHEFVAKDGAAPCQAADLLAWLWCKDADRRVPRLDFRNLVGSPHLLIHLDEQALIETQGNPDAWRRFIDARRAGNARGSAPTSGRSADSASPTRE